MIVPHLLVTFHERKPFCPHKREITSVKLLVLESKSEMVNSVFISAIYKLVSHSV
jgi:hypothetical protein